ncbi:sarcosine oxidase subunit alpha family protein [Labrys sp. LIt4]|uniref:sarcosine oxidase subunit alpha family protein n=1 Tax=Labrys sp. LIt4 TaxID=2821355 RepID=UPI001AE0E2FE|nr:sarcosine oxidase subunit alpha family protein [Labrys sp. LIt4]MBP0582053.1 sarcosine oxidase subunit alpha family protein [Labrys sp. LIt4]
MSEAVSFRLPSAGLVDRSHSVRFRFDGNSYEGLSGDTLASALLANGIRLVGRSFKYHRPRGIFTAGPEEPNALVELRTGARREPNTKATTVELFDGLEAASQNRWPSLKFDLLSVNQLAGPIFVGGFYYKTFMWPAALWEKLYEPMIRRAAGLGSASQLPDPDHYEKAAAFCDVLVIGAGPAGLMAALEAGRAGARVILCEDDFRLGGRLLSERHEVDGKSAAVFAADIEAELASMPEVRIFKRTQVFGVYDTGTYGALERVSDHLPVPPAHQPRQRLWHIMAKRCVNAMGAIERPIVFGGNDRPGVMLASAARSYLNRYGVAPGRQAVVFTTSDDGWRTAADLVAAGVTVAAIVDPRSQVDAAVSGWAGKAGTRTLLGASVTDAKGGTQGIKSVEVIAGRKRESIPADFLAVSGGWNPQVALTTHKGARPRWSDELAAFVPGDLPDGMSVAGAANGDFSLGACLRAGAQAGRAAAGDCGFSAGEAAIPACDDEPVGLKPLWHVAETKSKAFVDQQNDVTAKDIEIAHREGFRSVEHLKRYTTLGMATDQGKTSNIAGHAMMAGLLGRSMTEVGTTVSRPPHFPVAIGALAGPHRDKHFKATRLTAGHEWAMANGATMVEAGQWLRPQWFSRPGEKDWLESVCREVRTTRSVVGVCDVSTLGKIDIKGADAGAFLDRVYVNTFSTVAVGKCRYGLMLREDGFVMDDGTAARFAPDHYVISTTTANAVKVMQHLEFCRQALWPELDVSLSSITEQWSQYAVAGPKARDLLQKLYGSSADLSNEAFPYMGCATLPLGNVGSRLYRLSFSGELAYEIAVPAHYGLALLKALMALAEEMGGCAYGTEALGVMRVEKGHVAGNELNGQTTARDLGLGKMMSTKKDYIGRVLAQRPALVAPDRPGLVGVKPVNPADRLRAGSHFLKKGAAAVAANDEGFATSVVYSPMLESWIGLGLLANGPSRHGEVIRAYDPVRNGDIEVEVVSPIFFDPEGSRLHV